MATKKYTVQTPIRHDGERYKVGDSITMEPSEAKELLERGVLIDGKNKVEPNAGLPEPMKGEYKQEEAPKQLTEDPGSNPLPNPITEEA